VASNAVQIERLYSRSHNNSRSTGCCVGCSNAARLQRGFTRAVRCCAARPPLIVSPTGRSFFLFSRRSLSLAVAPPLSIQQEGLEISQIHLRGDTDGFVNAGYHLGFFPQGFCHVYEHGVMVTTQRRLCVVRTSYCTLREYRVARKLESETGTSRGSCARSRTQMSRLGLWSPWFPLSPKQDINETAVHHVPASSHQPEHGLCYASCLELKLAHNNTLHRDSCRNPWGTAAMKVKVHVPMSHKSVVVNVGRGLQTVKWLATVAAHRARMANYPHGARRLREGNLKFIGRFLPESLMITVRGMDPASTALRVCQPSFYPFTRT